MVASEVAPEGLGKELDAGADDAVVVVGRGQGSERGAVVLAPATAVATG